MMVINLFLADEHAVHIAIAVFLMFPLRMEPSLQNTLDEKNIKKWLLCSKPKNETDYSPAHETLA